MSHVYHSFKLFFCLVTVLWQWHSGYTLSSVTPNLTGSSPTWYSDLKENKMCRLRKLVRIQCCGETARDRVSNPLSAKQCHLSILSTMLNKFSWAGLTCVFTHMACRSNKYTSQYNIHELTTA